MRLPLPLTLALALSCGVTVVPEVQKQAIPEPTLSLDAICQPQPQLTKENRWAFQQHARLIEQILRESLQPDIKDGLKSSKLQTLSNVARWFLSPMTTSSYDWPLCDALAHAKKSATYQGEQLTYQFADTIFTLTDSLLIEAYGETLLADLTIEVQPKKEKFDPDGNPIMTPFKVDILPATTQQFVPAAKPGELTARMFRIPQGAGARQTSMDAAYFDRSGSGSFRIVTIIRGQITQGKKTVTRSEDTTGRVILGVSFP